MKNTVADLQREKRNVELALFAAAIVWKNARGTSVEGTCANHLACMAEEWLQISGDLDDAMSARLKELMAPPIGPEGQS